MTTNDITYNRSSGKVYLGGIPYFSKIFKDEEDAENFLKHVGLHLHLSVKKFKFLKTPHTQVN